MKHGRWSKFFREKTFLTVMLLALVLLTAVTVGAVYSHSQREGNENQYLDLDEEGSGVAVNATNAAEDVTKDEIPSANQVGAETLVNGTDSETKGTDSKPVDSDYIVAINLAYNGSGNLMWPIKGNVLLDYSMDTTVFFSTLKQYKVNPAILVQGEPGTNVVSPADAQVVSVGTNEEIGQFVVLKLGETYQATLGNLENLAVSEGQYILKGTVIGTLANPTKYYSVEGPNLYFKVTNSDKAEDPLDHLE